LQHQIERRQSARFAMLLFRLRHAAETHQGLAAGFLGRQAAPQVLFDGEGQMRGHLRI
jgi:hypothetical protein